ncbi:MAG: hypothetical protein PHQ65_10530 [Bacteroidales bacterium]|nr:hypothetical protein [Bacteroidales bacterium]MDD3665688.1 hypothetical protein [Bacteroidales bacterium]
MKKKLFALVALLFVSTLLLAQAPPTPPGSPGGGNTPVGGGAAPLAGGIAFLVGLAAGYGTSRWLYFKNHEQCK